LLASYRELLEAVRSAVPKKMSWREDTIGVADDFSRGKIIGHANGFNEARTTTLKTIDDAIKALP
jgi:hypothetical protein